MNWSRVAALFVKEWTDAMRDFRTLFAMVLMPVLFIPGIVFGFSALSLKSIEQQSQEPVQVAVMGDSKILGKLLLADPSLVVHRVYVGKEAIEPLMNACQFDILLELERGFDERLRNGEVAGVQVHYDRSCENFTRAYDEITARLADLQRSVVAARVTAWGKSTALLDPIKVENRNHTTPRKLGGFTLAELLPILLVLIAMQAAFHPSIDQVVGEKERKTLESLFVSPLKPVEILTGKFLSVLGISYGAALLNLASILLFFRMITRYYPEVEVSVNAGTVAMLMLLVLPVAAMFTAMAMGFSVFARSYKEAQSYLTPVFIVAIIPAFAGVLPGAEFTPKTALIPIGSAVLALRDVLLARAGALEVLWVTGYHVVLAGVFIWIATRLLESEDVLFAPTGVPWSTLFKRKAAGQAPTLWEALFLYLAVLLGSIIVGFLLFNRSAEGMAFTIVATEVVVIFGFSYGLVALLGYDVKNTFGLRYPGFSNLLAGPVMGLAGLGMTTGLAYFLSPYLPPPEEFNRELLGGIEHIGLLGSLVLMAFLPAVCEETLFRGAILSAVRRRMGVIPASVFVGVLFGLMHFQAPLRVLMVGVLGTLFTFIALRTNSIFPSMLAHATGNGLLVAVAVLAPQSDPTSADALSAPVAFISILVGVAFFGLAMILMSAPKLKTEKKDEPGGAAAGV